MNEWQKKIMEYKIPLWWVLGVVILYFAFKGFIVSI